MPSLEQVMKNMLDNRGISKQDASEIMKAVKNHKANAAMINRWNDSAEGYPVSLILALWLSVKHEAVQWMETNAPEHWARPLFEK